MSVDFKQIACSRWSDIPFAVVEMVNDLEARVIPLQNESGKEWDMVRVELWEDSGRILAFPSNESSTERIDISGTQIICKEVLDEVKNLDGSSLSDQEHDDQIEALVSRLAQLFIESVPVNTKCRFKVYNQDGESIHAT